MEIKITIINIMLEKDLPMQWKSEKFLAYYIHDFSSSLNLKALLRRKSCR